MTLSFIKILIACFKSIIQDKELPWINKPVRIFGGKEWNLELTREQVNELMTPLNILKEMKEELEKRVKVYLFEVYSGNFTWEQVTQTPEYQVIDNNVTKYEARVRAIIKNDSLAVTTRWNDILVFIKLLAAREALNLLNKNLMERLAKQLPCRLGEYNVSSQCFQVGPQYLHLRFDAEGECIATPSTRIDKVTPVVIAVDLAKAEKTEKLYFRSSYSMPDKGREKFISYMESIRDRYRDMAPKSHGKTKVGYSVQGGYITITNEHATISRKGHDDIKLTPCQVKDSLEILDLLNSIEKQLQSSDIAHRWHRQDGLLRLGKDLDKTLSLVFAEGICGTQQGDRLSDYRAAILEFLNIPKIDIPFILTPHKGSTEKVTPETIRDCLDINAIDEAIRAAIGKAYGIPSELIGGQTPALKPLSDHHSVLKGLVDALLLQEKSAKTETRPMSRSPEAVQEDIDALWKIWQYIHVNKEKGCVRGIVLKGQDSLYCEIPQKFLPKNLVISCLHQQIESQREKLQKELTLAKKYSEFLSNLF